MAGGNGSSKSSNPTRVRKRVEVDSASASADDSTATNSLKRARDGSAFTKCDECKKDVAVALINFHDCSLDAKIKMNLEAQVIEAPTEVKKKPAQKRKAKTSETKAKKEKKAKNPNAPKRPPTAFFVFMEDFRKTFKEAHPDNKSVATVAKEGGEKWKSLTEEEKKRYLDRAAELKSEYEKALESLNDDDNDQNEDEQDGAVDVQDEDGAAAEKEVEVENLDDEDA